MSTLSSVAAAEQAQLRLFLAQSTSQSINQLNNPLINNQFFRSFDIDADIKPSNPQSNDPSLTVCPSPEMGKKSDLLLDPAFNQSVDLLFDAPQYSVTSDFYAPLNQSSYQPHYETLIKKSAFDYSNDSHQPIKAVKQSNKRGYQDSLPDFEVNKRFQSGNQSSNQPVAPQEDLSETFGDWPDASNELFQSFDQSINQSSNATLSQTMNGAMNAFDYDINEIGVMDLSRFNSFGDQLLLAQSNAQLSQREDCQSLRSISGDMREASSVQSFFNPPLLQPHPSMFVGSPQSTLSQQSQTPEYAARSINERNEQSATRSIESVQSIDRSVSQTSSVQSLPPPIFSISNNQTSSLGHSVAHSSYQSAYSTQLVSQVQTTPKGEGHRRMKRRLTDKQRRAKIKDGLEHLRSLVHLHGDSSTDQASVVQSSINLIKQLVQESNNRKQELARLKDEGVSISIQLQAHVQAAQQIQTLQQRRVSPPAAPVQPVQPAQRETSCSSDNSQTQAPNPANLAQSLMTLLNQSQQQSNNSTSSQPGAVDNSMLSSYLLQTIQILSQLPMARLPQ